MDNRNKNSVFGVKLRMLREHQEFSQKEAAERLKILPDTYSRYERGIREPDYKTLKHIANFFNVSIDYLLDNEDEIALETTPILDFTRFVMDGKYTIEQHFPDEDERKTIRDVIKAMYKYKK